MPHPNSLLGSVPHEDQDMEVENGFPGDETMRSPMARGNGHDSQMSIVNPKRTAVDPALMFRTPLQVATIRVRNEEFRIHKELLVKDSLYFQRALNGSFKEAQTQEIVLDDVLPADFGFYVDVLYRSFFIPDLKLRKEQTGGSLSTKQILTFWQLTDRFLNPLLREMAKESLDHRLSLYAPLQWKKLYQRRSKEDIEDRIRRLQEAYHQCVDGNIPFEEDIVQATANAPAQVYSDSIHVMEPDFMARVSRQMIMQHADMALCKKRPADEMLGK